jgi:hypothetical protein
MRLSFSVPARLFHDNKRQDNVVQNIHASRGNLEVRFAFIERVGLSVELGYYYL